MMTLSIPAVGFRIQSFDLLESVQKVLTPQQHCGQRCRMLLSFV